MVSMEPETSIRGLFASAQAERKRLEGSPDSTASSYQENLQAAIASLEECRALANRIALFSPNETEDDVASTDLQYLLIDYYLAELITKDCVTSRRGVLERAREAYERYLGLLDNYDMLSKADKKLYERLLHNRNDFALLSNSDLTARRDTKISRFKQEQELKLKLEVCQPSLLFRFSCILMYASVPCPSSYNPPGRRLNDPRSLPLRNTALHTSYLPCSRHDSSGDQDPCSHASHTTSGAFNRR